MTEYTPNYNLDLYEDTDKPNLRDQYNSSMNKIDTQLSVQTTNISAIGIIANDAKTEAQAATTAAQAAGSAAEAAGTLAATADGKADTNSTRITQLGSDLIGETNARVAADNNLQAQIDAIDLNANGNVVIMGDSWSYFEAPNIYNWVTLSNFASRMQINADDIYNFAISGAGWTRNSNMTAQIGTASTTMETEEKERTKIVIVTAAVNDFNIDSALPAGNTWYNAVLTWFNSVQTLFPNAKIFWAPSMYSVQKGTYGEPGVMNPTRAAFESFYIHQCMTFLKNNGNNLNLVFSENFPYFWVGLPCSSVFQSDYVHLNEAGAKLYGNAIINALQGNEKISGWRYSYAADATGSDPNYLANIYATPNGVEVTGIANMNGANILTLQIEESCSDAFEYSYFLKRFRGNVNLAPTNTSNVAKNSGYGFYQTITKVYLMKCENAGVLPYIIA